MSRSLSSTFPAHPSVFTFLFVFSLNDWLTIHTYLLHYSLREILGSVDDAILPDNWLEIVEKWLALRGMCSIVKAEMVTSSTLMDGY